MDGVGKTRVMLTFSDEGTDQLDKNVTKDGNKKEETTVVYDTGDTRQPWGCALFCTIQLDALLLFFITISMISVSTSFIY